MSYFKFHLYFETLFIVSYHKSSDFHISNYYKVILQYNYKIKHLWILLFVSCYMYLFLDIFVICLQGVNVCFLCFVKEQENLNYPSSCVCVCVCVYLSCSVMSNCLWLYGLQPTRFPCPWNSPGKNTGVGCHFLLQVIFLTQRYN